MIIYFLIVISWWDYFQMSRFYLEFVALKTMILALSYDVLQDGRLGMIPREDECLVEAILKPIRILAKVAW